MAVYFLELELQMVVSYHLEPGFLWFELESSGRHLVLFFLYCKDAFDIFNKFNFFHVLEEFSGKGPGSKKVFGICKAGDLLSRCALQPSRQGLMIFLPPLPTHEIHCFYNQRKTILALFFFEGGYEVVPFPNKHYIYFFKYFRKAYLTSSL